MFGKTLAIVCVLAIVIIVGVSVGFYELRATNRQFHEIDAGFRQECLNAFSPRVQRPEELCGCLWEEVRGADRMDMVKRLMALQNGSEDARRDYITRVSRECASRLHIQSR